MKNTKKKLTSQSIIAKASFSCGNITKHSGLNTVAKYMNCQNIVKGFGNSFPTVWHNATKFGINQILVAITLASISGISRIYRITRFSGVGLIKALLKLDKAINENAISSAFNNLEERGAPKLQMLLLSKNAGCVKAGWKRLHWMPIPQLNQSVAIGGAEKGYKTTNKGAKSYHPFLVFVSDLKLLYHTWFRSGSAYTANGVVDFLKEVKASFPGSIRKVIFRADSGSFSGDLFDLFESFGCDYLVKVKQKNLGKLLESQT